MRFQSGSMRMVSLGLWFLCIWAFNMACSKALVSWLSWNSGRDIDVPVHAVSMSGSEENIVISGSFD